ncbi:hypothetical protein HDU93_006634 [Gonapodya sp. JEL0774]|nr:hypothetical protein HDU93_006634 [Gonapodya sp. JEL0774]
MVNHWRQTKKFACLAGWRNERYPVYGKKVPRKVSSRLEAAVSRNAADTKKYPANLLLTIERAASGLFGFRTFGAHLNGFVVQRQLGSQVTVQPPTNTNLLSPPVSKLPTYKMWIATRSMSKSTWPGWLDNVIAGGIPWDDTPYATMVRECEEEGNVPLEIAQMVVPTSTITYTTHTSLGICPETQYIYDLEFPADFSPSPKDGEVESFRLVDLHELQRLLRAGKFKPNCGVVVIDWMVRRGIITPENEPDYLELVSALRRDLDFPGPDHTDHPERTAKGGRSIRKFPTPSDAMSLSAPSRHTDAASAASLSALQAQLYEDGGAEEKVGIAGNAETDEENGFVLQIGGGALILEVETAAANDSVERLVD